MVYSSLVHANTTTAGNCEPTNETPNYYRKNIDSPNSLLIHPGIGQLDADAFNPDDVEILYDIDDNICSTPIGYSANNGDSASGSGQIETNLNYMKAKLSKFNKYKNREAPTIYKTTMVMFVSTHNVSVDPFDAGTDPFKGHINNALSQVKHSVTLGTDSNYCKQTFAIIIEGKQGELTFEGETPGTPCEIKVTLSSGSIYFGDLSVNKETLTFNDQSMIVNRTGKHYIEVQLFRSRDDINNPNVGSPLTLGWGIYDGVEGVYFYYPDGTIIE